MKEVRQPPVPIACAPGLAERVSAVQPRPTRCCRAPAFSSSLSGPVRPSPSVEVLRRWLASLPATSSSWTTRGHRDVGLGRLVDRRGDPVGASFGGPRDAQTTTRQPRELAWWSGKSESLAVSRCRVKWPLTCGFAAPPAGLEPATRCLEGSRSIQLSYRGLDSPYNAAVICGRP